MSHEFLVWFDDHKNTPIAERIRIGADAYRDRFQIGPRVVLVNEAEAAGLEVQGMEVLVKPYVRRNNYYFGMYDPS